MANESTSRTLQQLGNDFLTAMQEAVKKLGSEKIGNDDANQLRKLAASVDQMKAISEQAILPLAKPGRKGQDRDDFSKSEIEKIQKFAHGKTKANDSKVIVQVELTRDVEGDWTVTDLQ